MTGNDRAPETLKHMFNGFTSSTELPQGHLTRHSQGPPPAVLPPHPMFNQENGVGHCAEGQ